MRIFARLFRYVRPYTAPLCLAFFLALIQIVIELARPWPVKVVVDYVLGDRPSPPLLSAASAHLAGAATKNGMLIWSVVAAVTIVATGAILSVAVLYLMVDISRRLVCDLARDLFEKLQRQSLAYHGRHSVGDLIERLTGDVFVAYFAIGQVCLPGVISLLSLAGMFIIMAQLDITLAILAFAVVPLLVASLAVFAKPMDRTTAKQFERQGSLMALIEQSLSAIRAVQGFAREDYIQRKVETRTRDLSDAFNAATRVSGLYKEVTTAITGLAAAFLLGVGGSRVLKGGLSVGDLLIFIGYLTALYGPVSALSLAVGAAVQVGARGRRVFEVIDAGEELPERPGALALSHVRGEVIFENVAFGYRQQESEPHTAPVLSGISFETRPGQIVAIVGATGAGKSSLVSLLIRFYDPWEGRILVDGHDVRDLSLQSLREHVALVLQDPFLFPMSIADNIGFGRPGARRDEIVAAAEVAHAHGVIERLPQGYDTLIGEKGNTLSGGERQRIAIARAVLKDAPILILDEPTSALDARTEAQIFEALTRLMRDRTTFVISHRLSTIRRAEQIIVLEHGHIVERGTHETLLAEGCVYAGLYAHQHHGDAPPLAAANRDSDQRVGDRDDIAFSRPRNEAMDPRD